MYEVRAGQWCWAATGQERPDLGSETLYVGVRSLYMADELYMDEDTGERFRALIKPISVSPNRILAPWAADASPAAWT